MATKKRGLGKNLSELLSITPESFAEVTGKKGLNKKNSLKQESNELSIVYLPISHLERGKYQPRKDINIESLEELATSIKSQGIIQPIVVRKIEKNRYEIIAGERRWRAAQIAELTEIPAIIREVSDEVTMAFSLIENIQRENLNPVEEAEAIQRLIDECQLTHQDVALMLGKSRATITNLLRVLSLNNDVKLLLENADIEFGHAKVLLALTGSAQSQAAKIVVAKSLSVRETEALVKRMSSTTGGFKLEKTIDPDVKHLQKLLTDKFGVMVKIHYNSKGKGRLILSYNNLQELEGILLHIK
jgi:ParB family transcriptional regulator, chromosome partitioning protein